MSFRTPSPGTRTLRLQSSSLDPLPCSTNDGRSPSSRARPLVFPSRSASLTRLCRFFVVRVHVIVGPLPIIIANVTGLPPGIHHDNVLETVPDELGRQRRAVHATKSSASAQLGVRPYVERYGGLHGRSCGRCNLPQILGHGPAPIRARVRPPGSAPVRPFLLSAFLAGWLDRCEAIGNADDQSIIPGPGPRWRPPIASTRAAWPAGEDPGGAGH